MSEADYQKLSTEDCSSILKKYYSDLTHRYTGSFLLSGLYLTIG